MRIVSPSSSSKVWLSRVSVSRPSRTVPTSWYSCSHHSPSPAPSGSIVIYHIDKRGIFAAVTSCLFSASGCGCCNQSTEYHSTFPCPFFLYILPRSTHSDIRLSFMPHQSLYRYRGAYICCQTSPIRWPHRHWPWLPSGLSLLPSRRAHGLRSSRSVHRRT